MKIKSEDETKGKKRMRFLEIACFNVASALAAAEAGADRIELCAGADVGGTTPLINDLKFLINVVEIPVNVMIRPRGGNFVYSEDELGQMKCDIESFVGYANGFVFGVLDQESRVDEGRCRKLMESAAGTPWTFHRAFDEVSDLVEAAKQIAELGIDSILTSGGKPSAIEGAEDLEMLIAKSQNIPKVIVGGGVRSSNIQKLMQTTQAQWFHSSALVDDTGVASKEEIRKLLEKLRND